MIDWGWVWEGVRFFVAAFVILGVISLVTELVRWIGRKWL